MALQMSGGGANVVFGPRTSDTFHPDLDWLEAELAGAGAGEAAGPAPPKMVVITNPCNPSGEPCPVPSTRPPSHPPLEVPCCSSSH